VAGRYSDPEFLIECMDRHRGWTVVVCLVDAEYDAGEPIRRAAALVAPSVTVCLRLRRRSGSSRMRST
jgi:hypothetical protein